MTDYIAGLEMHRCRPMQMVIRSSFFQPCSFVRHFQVLQFQPFLSRQESEYSCTALLFQLQSYFYFSSYSVYRIVLVLVLVCVNEKRTIFVFDCSKIALLHCTIGANFYHFKLTFTPPCRPAHTQMKDRFTVLYLPKMPLLEYSDAVQLHQRTINFLFKLRAWLLKRKLFCLSYTVLIRPIPSGIRLVAIYRITNLRVFGA